MPATADALGGEPGKVIRPETLVLALFGDQVLDRGIAVATGSVISVLGRLGVTEHATRAVLARMVRRNLLYSAPRGRQAYLGLTPHGAAVMRDGERRLRAPVVERDWDGRWTLLTFSVPETRRADRHVLRTRLGWAGFGLLRSGLWVSTRDVEVAGTLSELDLLKHAEVFRAEPSQWSDPAKIAGEAWDLAGLAAGYRDFLHRWTGPGFGELDELARRVRLSAEWLLLNREDPVLPVALLPPGWPGVEAEKVIRTLRQWLARAADKLAGELDTIAT